VLFGGNGAGKTSVLEAIVVLSRGRSFRTTQASELIGGGGNGFRVYAESIGRDHKTHRLGLERSKKHWRGRKDGRDLVQLSQLTRTLPLVLMEPNSHLLISGSPEARRKYLDWGMFHVEPEFLDTYRNYTKILKQRNAALRNRQAQVIDSIDDVFGLLGDQLDALRKIHCVAVVKQVRTLLKDLSPAMKGFDMEYDPGWNNKAFRNALNDSRDKDFHRGVTGCGPHRADLLITINKVPARQLLSRGEQKILSAALLLSQAAILSGAGEKPLVLLDDLSSEFDQRHFENVLETSVKLGGQVWITGIVRCDTGTDNKVFHVKHGKVQEVV